MRTCYSLEPIVLLARRRLARIVDELEQDLACVDVVFELAARLCCERYGGRVDECGV